MTRLALAGGVALALLLAFALLLPGTFLTARNLGNVAGQVSMLAVVAFAMTAVMAMGDFDLSVGSMASLAGVTAATLMACGLARRRGGRGGAPPGGRGGPPQRAPRHGAEHPALRGDAGHADHLLGRGLPRLGRTHALRPAAGLRGRRARVGGGRAGPRARGAGVLVLVWFTLEHTSYGRRLYAIGGNREAARLAGLPVRRLRASAFAVTGLGAALAGLMLAARVDSANPTQGSGLMLDAIAAVFLGMTLSEEGEPRALGTLAGVALLALLDNGLTQLAVDSYLREVLVGAIILAAVGLARAGR
jgi:ribose transport system permease protein